MSQWNEMCESVRNVLQNFLVNFVSWIPPAQCDWKWSIILFICVIHLFILLLFGENFCIIHLLYLSQYIEWDTHTPLIMDLYTSLGSEKFIFCTTQMRMLSY